MELGDLLDYQGQRAIARRTALLKLAHDAEENGPYDVPDEDYLEAMRSARHEIAEERKEFPRNSG